MPDQRKKPRDEIHSTVTDMWASEEARVKAVRSALRDIASTVCERCVLRMAGIKNSKFHQTSYIERADANGKDSEDTVCTSCTHTK